MTTDVTDRLEVAEADAELLESKRGESFTEAERGEWRERGPVAFGRERLGTTFWRRQVDILEAVWRHPRVAVRSANSMGKNHCAGDLMTWWLAIGGAVIYTSNTDRQLDVGMSHLARGIRASGLPFERYHRRVRVGGETRLWAFTSSSADAVRGFHDPAGLLIVIDEGQGSSVEATAYDAAFSCATGERDRIVVLGNPAHPGTRFHQISRASNWRALKIPASEHPNIVEGRTVIPGGPAPDWPEQIAQEYGRESPFYTAFVEAEFPEESADALVRREWLEKSRELHRTNALLDGSLMTLGLDVARLGPDMTMLCARRGRHVIEFVGWKNALTTTTVERTLAETRRLMAVWTVGEVAVDLTGVGGGVYDALVERMPRILDTAVPLPWGADPYRYPPRVTSFEGGSRAAQPERFVNRRSESFWNIRKLLEAGQLALPPEPKLDEELLATTVEFTANGKIQIQPKDLIKRRLGRSPDLADSLAISLATEVDYDDRPRAIVV